MKEQEIKVTVHEMYKRNEAGVQLIDKNDSTEVVQVARLDPEAAYVTMSTSRKAVVGLPKYSSASFDVFLSAPCPQEETQMELCYAWMGKFCEAKVEELVNNVKSA